MFLRLTIIALSYRWPIGAGLFSAAPATNPSPTTQAATAGISGRITAEGPLRFDDVVVYLEPVDPQPPGSLMQAARPVQISQHGARFAPPLLVVCAGQSVEFLNDEDRPVEHNVFSNAPAKRFDLGLFSSGESRTVRFDKPGPVMLYCSIHRFMDGVIYVCPSRFFARVAPDGGYRIDGVTPAKYTLRTWQRHRRFHEQEIPLTLGPASQRVIDLKLGPK
jgi:plastocyanin